MSGRVVVHGNASQSAAATGRGGLVVVYGDASARCGISMKGVDIVVRGRVGHLSAFMAQTGRLVVCGDAGDALGDSIYEARLYVRGDGGRPGRRLRSEGAPRRACAEVRALLESAGHRRRRTRGLSPLRLGAQALQLLHRQRERVLMEGNGGNWALRESYLYDRNVIAEIQRAAQEGIYDIRGFGAKRRVPHFDDLLLLGASISRYPLEGYRERCDTDVTLGTRFAKKPLELQDPDHDRGDELRRALGAGEGGARARRDRDGHVDDDRRRRHDAGGARALEDPRLPAPPLPLRHEPGRPAQGRRDRGRGRPGRQAGRRRHAPRAQDLRPRRRDARTSRRGSTSAAPPAIPTGRGRTTSRSRSASCARSRTGRSRSSSRSARPAPTTTCSLR